MTLLISISCEPSREFPNHKYYNLSGQQTGFEQDYDDDYYAFGVQLDLTTVYDTLPPVHFMTCSWADDLGRTSDTTFYIGHHSCDANFQSFERITSKDTLRFLNIVVTPNDKKFEYSQIRVGISLVDTIKVSWNKLNFGDLFMTKSEHDSIKSQYNKLINDPKNIVWSNSIKLTKMNMPIKHLGSVGLICGSQTTHEHCR